ncbi:MAG: hypothetical protein IIA67_06220 [Planctomycetes bacterium]|nr:hypothetical protein [Planctomycetota bacterium]
MHAPHRIRLLLAFASMALGTSLASAADDPPKPKPKYKSELLRGRVVYLAEAMQRRFGAKTVKEAGQRILALETAKGTLHPIFEDVRGRAFRSDKRLRDREVTLLVRRYDGSPVVQIIRLFAHNKSGLAELDYWCDICAIPMFELKPCDCCGGPIRLREQKAKLPVISRTHGAAKPK